jgi:hypothetical protein
VAHQAHAPHTAAADSYRARRPEQTVLHQTLSAHFGEFRARADEQGGLPKFVVRELEAYLRCGLLAYGCVLLACRACGHSQLVAFSCKRRGICPSCCGRRMSDAALHLVERVLPAVPIRQWVCSLPCQLRALLGYDPQLCSAVAAFMKELSCSYRPMRLLEIATTPKSIARALYRAGLGPQPPPTVARSCVADPQLSLAFG